MRVLHGFDTIPHLVHPAVTVGSFDGVHRGHRAIIEQLVREAFELGGESVVFTFEPHPRITLGRAEGLRLLTTLDEKIGLLEQLGVENVLVIPFDRAFSELSGKTFVERYLLGKIGAEVLVMGYNHRFGHDRIIPASTPALRVVRVNECDLGGERISSTVIRKLVDAGNIAEAERLAGHPLHVTVKK